MKKFNSLSPNLQQMIYSRSVSDDEYLKHKSYKTKLVKFRVYQRSASDRYLSNFFNFTEICVNIKNFLTTLATFNQNFFDINHIILYSIDKKKQNFNYHVLIETVPKFDNQTYVVENIDLKLYELFVQTPMGKNNLYINLSEYFEYDEFRNLKDMFSITVNQSSNTAKYLVFYTSFYNRNIKNGLTDYKLPNFFELDPIKQQNVLTKAIYNPRYEVDYKEAKFNFMDLFNEFKTFKAKLRDGETLNLKESIYLLYDLIKDKSKTYYVFYQSTTSPNSLPTIQAKYVIQRREVEDKLYSYQWLSVGETMSEELQQNTNDTVYVDLNYFKTYFEFADVNEPNMQLYNISKSEDTKKLGTTFDIIQYVMLLVLLCFIFTSGEVTWLQYIGGIIVKAISSVVIIVIINICMFFYTIFGVFKGHLIPATAYDYTKLES